MREVDESEREEVMRGVGGRGGGVREEGRGREEEGRVLILYIQLFPPCHPPSHTSHGT